MPVRLPAGLLGLAIALLCAAPCSAAELIRDSFTAAAPADAIWSVQRTNEGSVSIEEMNGRRWAHLLARANPARGVLTLETRAALDGAPYSLSFRVLQKADERNAYAAVINHGKSWQLDLSPDGKLHLATTGAEGVKLRWASPITPGSEYVVEVANEPERVRVTLKDAGGKPISESNWQPHVHDPSAKGISFSAIARTGSVGMYVTDVALDGVAAERKATAAPTPAPAVVPAVPVPARNPADLVPLANPQLRLVFSRSDLMLVGGTHVAADLPLIIESAKPRSRPLWRLVFARDNGRGEKIELDSLAPTADRRIESRRTATGEQVVLKWSGLSLPEAERSVDVTVTVDLPSDSAQSFWRIAADSRAAQWGLWEVRFPVLNLARPTRDAGRPVGFLQPYRYGVLRPDVFQTPKLFARYPTAMMHMQFVALLGDVGIYLAAHDTSGYYKSFELNTDTASRAATCFELTIEPSGRGARATRYESPFAFVLGTFKGDWFDAAQTYRRWAVTQPWCAKGPLAQRRDVPAWCKDATLVLKNNGLEYVVAPPDAVSTAGREIGPNAAAFAALLKAYGGPVGSIWYGWWKQDFSKSAVPKGGAVTSMNLGQRVEPVTGLTDALKRLHAQGAQSFAYIQSVIYDQGRTRDGDSGAMQPFAARTLDGPEALYGDKSFACWCMCHSTAAWQQRLSELGVRAVRDFGFQGVYLDSFGRSVAECFNPDHGHPVGGGGFITAGTHKLGESVRNAIKAVNPDAATSAESAVEQHIDIVDLNLLSYCTISDGVPLWAAVYHDYSMQYGRSLGTDNLYVDGGHLFIMGAQIGRLFARDDPPAILKPGAETYDRYLRQLVTLKRQCGDFLTLGRMLRPVVITTDLPRVTNGAAQKVNLPVVLTSSWQSADKRAAVVFLNLGDEDRAFDFECDLAEYGFAAGTPLAVARRTISGVVPAAPVTAGKWKGAEKLAPHEVVILELTAAGPAKDR